MTMIDLRGPKNAKGVAGRSHGLEWSPHEIKKKKGAVRTKGRSRGGKARTLVGKGIIIMLESDAFFKPRERDKSGRGQGWPFTILEGGGAKLGVTRRIR